MTKFSIFMVIVLACYLVNRRLFQLRPAKNTFFSIPGLKKHLDQNALNEILRKAGYSYSPEQDTFYSNLYAWQRDMGYCRLYDEAAIMSGMIIDCEPIYFTYGGKRWLIEFWKGQYGMTTGCEIGVYNTDDFDLNIPEVFSGTFYQSVGDHELLYISCTLIKNGEPFLTRKGYHWWLIGFKLGEFSEPEELELDLSITLKNRKMKEAFVHGLYEAGYSQDEVITYGNTVRLTFGKPKTPQPLARTATFEWITQRKNEMLCAKYREITDPYDTLLDKMNAILSLDPDTFQDILDMNKNKPSLVQFQAIQKYSKKPLGRSNKKISRVFEAAKEIPFDDTSKFIFMCDCHRGNGSWTDDFQRNRNLYIAALNHYYRNKFTYIELGDGDELWENNHLSAIINVHRDVFQLLAKFYRQGRLYFIFGNHDMVKKNQEYVKNNLYRYFDEREKAHISLFEGIQCHEALVLKHRDTGNKILLTHGHQVDFFNYTMWKTARFLVRYLWRPLNFFGVNDPTSTAKNYKRKERVEKRLSQWIRNEKHMVISGHTHRPMFPEPGDPPYFNGGSSIHPQDITGIEIAEGFITLVKWNVQTNSYGRLFVKRDVIAGPVKLEHYSIRSNTPEF